MLGFALILASCAGCYGLWEMYFPEDFDEEFPPLGNHDGKEE